MSEPTFPYPNGYRVTYDVGNGLEYADSTAWSGVTATISPFKTGASSPLVYAKITQYGSPTLPTLINELFHNCCNLVEVEFDGLDASKVTRIAYLFSNNYALTTIKGLETLNCSNVTVANHMFRECRALTSVNLPITGFPKATLYESMFTGCVGLTELDLSTWNTSLAINTKNMHQNCSNLVTIYVGDLWNMSSVTTGGNMFIGCAKLVGAVAYNASQTGVAMANYTTGYLTYKSTAEPTQMLVSGAGSTEYNGTYAETGTKNGYPRYIKPYENPRGGLFIVSLKGYGAYTWVISVAGLDSNSNFLIFSGARYYSEDDVATPDLVTNWIQRQGALPLPTVTAAGGGDPSSIINHIMHYRRLMSR